MCLGYWAREREAQGRYGLCFGGSQVRLWLDCGKVRTPREVRKVKGVCMLKWLAYVELVQEQRLWEIRVAWTMKETKRMRATKIGLAWWIGVCARATIVGNKSNWKMRKVEGMWVSAEVWVGNLEEWLCELELAEKMMKAEGVWTLKAGLVAWLIGISAGAMIVGGKRNWENEKRGESVNIEV